MPQEDSRRALSLLDTPIDRGSDALGQRLDTNAAALPYSRSRSIRRRLDLKTSKSTIIAVYCVCSVLDFESNLKTLNALTWYVTIGSLNNSDHVAKKPGRFTLSSVAWVEGRSQFSSVLISCHFEFSC